jgi:hypothetical protein
MQKEIGFNGDFTVAARQTLRPGGWYIGFLCASCGQHFAIMEDPTGSGELGFTGAGRFRTICPGCEQAQEFGVADMVVFQSAQGGPSSTS